MLPVFNHSKDAYTCGRSIIKHNKLYRLDHLLLSSSPELRKHALLKVCNVGKTVYVLCYYTALLLLHIQSLHKCLGMNQSGVLTKGNHNKYKIYVALMLECPVMCCRAEYCISYQACF